jgi:hypothetical protein
MRISQETYDHYWDNGWTVVDNVYTADEVERVARTGPLRRGRSLNLSSRTRLSRPWSSTRAWRTSSGN